MYDNTTEAFEDDADDYEHDEKNPIEEVFSQWQKDNSSGKNGLDRGSELSKSGASVDQQLGQAAREVALAVTALQVTFEGQITSTFTTPVMKRLESAWRLGFENSPNTTNSLGLRTGEQAFIDKLNAELAANGSPLRIRFMGNFNETGRTFQLYNINYRPGVYCEQRSVHVPPHAPLYK